MINYLENFPLKSSILPEDLKNLLLPINDNSPDLMVEITKREGSPVKKYCHMTMITIPKSKMKSIHLMKDLDQSGVISSSIPDCGRQGELKKLPSLPSEYDYLVASFEHSSFYNYNLSEKVWMTLGLSQRCIGNDEQKIVYDDLNKPIMNVASGEATHQYLSRNVTWKMRNKYIREYLWMRGHVGVRVFNYEQRIEDTPELRKLIGDPPSWFNDSSTWYDMDIQPLDCGFYLKVWATVVAVLPIKSPEKNIYMLKWPGDNKAMNKNRISPFTQSSDYKYIYLKDTFLEKYEKEGIYSRRPLIDPDGNTLCPISYKGVWDVEGLQRIGRNILKASAYDFYKSPNDEILHGYDYAVTPGYANSFDPIEENIVQKTWRFINSLLEFGRLFFIFSSKLDCKISSAEDFLEFCSHQNVIAVLENYQMMRKLAWVTTVDMMEYDFLSRCNTLHECIQKIKTGFLKNLLLKSGVKADDIKGFGCLKLLEKIKNILDYLVQNSENESAWVGASKFCDWGRANNSVSALFINNDLRQINSHEKNQEIGEGAKLLKTLGFDSALVSGGYGYAFDFIFNKVIDAIKEINNSLNVVLTTEY